MAWLSVGDDHPQEVPSGRSASGAGAGLRTTAEGLRAGVCGRAGAEDGHVQWAGPGAHGQVRAVHGGHVQRQQQQQRGPMISERAMIWPK